MSIFADDSGSLAIFNDLLHDLYFEIPESGFEASGDTLALMFFERRKRRGGKMFALLVHFVTRIDLQGNVSKLPGNEAQLNKIVFHNGTVQFECIHPVRLLCSVTRLRLALDEVETNEGVERGKSGTA